ncbi:MAG: class I SAM-dependent methyltransferase, partial [Pseudomonadota bacterium]
MASNDIINRHDGIAFQDEQVVDAYVHRPPYPQALYGKLLELMHAPCRVLDLGCGPGKIALGLADRVEAVTAVDFSAAMIALGQKLDKGQHQNIEWLCGPAETAPYAGQYDLITTAASLHWMDHPVLFARLKQHIHEHSVFAIIDGDGAHEAPWQDDWVDFLKT